MLHQFRVTKYDPAHRDSHGAYRHEEWTSFSDIGRRFSGKILTQADYDAVEDAYVVSAIGFLKQTGVDTLTACGLENTQRHASAPD